MGRLFLHLLLHLSLHSDGGQGGIASEHAAGFLQDGQLAGQLLSLLNDVRWLPEELRDASIIGELIEELILKLVLHEPDEVEAYGPRHAVADVADDDGEVGVKSRPDLVYKGPTVLVRPSPRLLAFHHGVHLIVRRFGAAFDLLHGLLHDPRILRLFLHCGCSGLSLIHWLHGAMINEIRWVIREEVADVTSHLLLHDSPRVVSLPLDDALRHLHDTITEGGEATKNCMRNTPGSVVQC
mmetsp:Transcript_4410/g.10200  ORF Transcript_4410/g.10200 Transcript_4410/m.10200 type:complete len:239 (+) Transcript_4410:395-1111(+)